MITFERLLRWLCAVMAWACAADAVCWLMFGDFERAVQAGCVSLINFYLASLREGNP